MRLSGLSLLMILAVSLVGCGSSSSSTPIAPDIPVSSASNGAGSPDLNKIKGAEHSGGSAERQAPR